MIRLSDAYMCKWQPLLFIWDHTQHNGRLSDHENCKICIEEEEAEYRGYLETHILRNLREKIWKKKKKKKKKVIKVFHGFHHQLYARSSPFMANYTSF